jgi:Lrp/AsnC family leucine-responsive transcriptional regulator
MLQLDATDAAILRCLQEDARASLRTIAKKVGVSAPTVGARITNLKQLGILRGYRTLLDPERLNETTLALVVKTRLRAAEDVARKLAERKWARRVLLGRPGWILVDATVVQREAVDGILKEASSLTGVVDVQEYSGLRPVKDEPLVLLTDRLSTSLTCFECKGPIAAEPLKVRRDGRYHYFCCHSCERLYLEKYERIRAAARKRD